VLPLVRPPALIPLEPPRPLPLIPLLPPRPEADRELDAPREPPEALDERELLAALRDEPEPALPLRDPPEALRLELPPLPVLRLLPDAPDALRELPVPLERELPDALRAPPAESPLAPAPRLRVRSSTSPVSALSAACVESRDVIPRPIVRLRPFDPDPVVLPALPVLPPAFVPPLRFEAMPSSR
jgi:hypothetical protein